MKSWITKNGYKVRKILGGRSNCFLISFRGRHLLVDAGRRNRWKTLNSRLKPLGVNDRSLKALILTHAHFDHAENAADVKEKYKTAIIIHNEEGDCLKRGDNPVIRGATVVTKLMTDLFVKRPLLRYLRYKPADYDIPVEEKYDLNKLGFKGYLIHTPGHSPGSVSVIIDDEIALVGDTLFGVFKGLVFPLFADDPSQLIRSWEKLLDTDCLIYLPAHGWEISKRLLQQQYGRHKKLHTSR